MEKQRWEESEKRRDEKEDQRRERVRGKKIQAREKVEKSRFTAFFQWFVAPEDRKVGSLKRLVQSHLARWEMKNCKGEKQISKSKCTKHTNVGPLLEVEMSKKCMPLWREAHVQVNVYKTLHVRTTFRSCAVEKVHAVVVRSTFRSRNVQALLGIELSKKCTPLWREAGFQVKMFKTLNVRTTLDVQMSFRAAGARDCAPCQKWQNVRVL